MHSVAVTKKAHCCHCFFLEGFANTEGEARPTGVYFFNSLPIAMKLLPYVSYANLGGHAKFQPTGKIFCQVTVQFVIKKKTDAAPTKKIYHSKKKRKIPTFFAYM